MVKKKPSARDVLGPVMREFRQRRGLSQEELGGRAGVHRTYVGQVERGERNPSVESLDRLLGALGVSWTQFGTAIDADRDGSGGR